MWTPILRSRGRPAPSDPLLYRHEFPATYTSDNEIRPRRRGLADQAGNRAGRRGWGREWALVLDELAYRSVLGWLRDTGDNNPVSTFRTSTSAVMRKMRTRLGRLWAAIDELDFELATTDRTVISQAVRVHVEPGALHLAMPFTLRTLSIPAVR